MDKVEWQAKREAEVEALVRPRAARYEGWSRPRRFVTALGVEFCMSCLAFTFIALIWTRDRTGADVTAGGFGVVLVAMAIWFTVSPGHLLRVFARSQTSSTDPAESPPWTIPG